jgi:hypothetical protein
MMIMKMMIKKMPDRLPTINEIVLPTKPPV